MKIKCKKSITVPRTMTATFWDERLLSFTVFEALDNPKSKQTKTRNEKYAYIIEKFIVFKPSKDQKYLIYS